MSRRPVVLVSGAGGEIGQALIERLAEEGGSRVLALDLREPAPETRSRCEAAIVGDVLDQTLLDRLVSEFEIHAVYHLAAILSTRCEFTPETGHQVNVQGTLNLLKLAVEQSRWHGETVRFFFPSSIAVYGLPDLRTKSAAGAVHEKEWTEPITMYGCNKLACEHLGRYYADHYRQLAADTRRDGVDFRALRYPGLISAATVPDGGTSDFLPEMIHAAAKDVPYACFVRPDTRIAFMAMPDAVEALLALMRAPRSRLSTHVYNVASFNPSAGEFAEMVQEAFPGAATSFEPDPKRQAIVDSWPEHLEVGRARKDWGFEPAYDLERALGEYLTPRIGSRYRAR